MKNPLDWNGLSQKLREQTPYPALLITGPTASGKTALSVALAQCLSAEIICMDSMQLYEGLDIGAAKPDEAERQGVPHHLFDHLKPTQRFSVHDYVERARDLVKTLQEQGKLAVFCGGTVQYALALKEGLQFYPIGYDPALRQRLERQYDEQGGQVCLNELAAVDPDQASRLAPTDRKRVVRALERYYLTGLTRAQLDAHSRQKGPERDYVMFAIDLPRALLYERINARVQAMMEQGLEAEVKRLNQTYPDAPNSLGVAIGYKEWQAQRTRAETVDKIQQNSRHYAKRQLSWLGANPDVHWLDSLDRAMQLSKIYDVLQARLSPENLRNNEDFR